MSQNKNLFFREIIITYDGYQLIDDEYTVVQPFVLCKCDLDNVPYYIDVEHGFCYKPAIFPLKLFRELLLNGAVQNVGDTIVVWHWYPLKAIPILKKYGYTIHKEWLEQYIKNTEANKKALTIVRKNRYTDYVIREGVLFVRKPVQFILDCHNNKQYKGDINKFYELVKKYDPLAKIKHV